MTLETHFYNSVLFGFVRTAFEPVAVVMDSLKQTIEYTICEIDEKVKCLQNEEDCEIKTEFLKKEFILFEAILEDYNEHEEEYLKLEREYQEKYSNSLF